MYPIGLESVSGVVEPSDFLTYGDEALSDDTQEQVIELIDDFCSVGTTRFSISKQPRPLQVLAEPVLIHQEVAMLRSTYR